jgi:predicted Ser/Thr protein kinase
MASTSENIPPVKEPSPLPSTPGPRTAPPPAGSERSQSVGKAPTTAAPPPAAAAAKPSASAAARSGPPPAARSDPAKLPGLSALSESSLEKSILRRGLATAQEIEACKAYRAKMKEESKSLLDIMVAAKVLTQSQSQRLMKEFAAETQRKLEIPGYQLIERIGKGSMGIVYKARQTSVDRIVAVKVLLDSLAQNREFIKRFDREAKIAAKLAHNNVVNAIDAGEVDGRYYFVMEYIEGATVKDELEKNKVFDEKAAIKIVLAVAEALQHAHHRGLIHRDIKPENIILMPDGNVKLADLGLARLTADEKWAMSEAGMAIGTPYYISPEQVRGQVDVDIRADIYSLGATFYHMVTGQVPYAGETPTEVMRKHVDKNVPLVPPDHINTNLSSGLGEVIETMMAKNREDRYRNPDDLILDLKCLLAGDPPMIAHQKLDSLAHLAQGESTKAEEDAVGPSVSEAQLVEMAGYVNSRANIIAVLAMLLAVSVLTNVMMLVIR